MLKKKILVLAFAILAIVGLVFVAHSLTSKNSTNPLFNKKWIATVFTSSNGTIQRNPSETLIFKPHLVLVKVGMVLYKEPVLRYTIIRDLKQGTATYSTVFVVPSSGPKIALYVFNHGTSLLTIRKDGDQTIQQRYSANRISGTANTG
jgi:hypothetical protein